MNKLAIFFKLLSDETRLRILILLYHKKLCVCELCGIMEVSQPNISKHLAKLRDMNFVKDHRQEQFIFYSLNIEDKALKDMFQNIIDNIYKYPILKSDIEKINGVEKYLKSCK